jgi:hypothetical protein
MGCRWRNGCQLWKVAANTLNKQLWTTDKGCPPTLGWDMGLKPFTVKNKIVKKFSRGSDLGRFFG